jgi:hypothetical protein
MLFIQQEKDKWYKFDYIFSWEDYTVQVFVNHTLLTIQDFHMAIDPFASGQGQQVQFTGVDSLVLYTLTPGGKSEFMDVKLCNQKKCADHDYLKILAAHAGVSSPQKILLATFLIYLSMLQLESTDDKISSRSEGSQESELGARYK